MEIPVRKFEVSLDLANVAWEDLMLLATELSHWDVAAGILIVKKRVGLLIILILITMIVKN